ncbi:MAG: hypothetical protein KDD06_08515, partial [Phaeodactylibacter sp.]|nr:hypothetical protein [Phaeodactylibacter sp.]
MQHTSGISALKVACSICFFFLLSSHASADPGKPIPGYFFHGGAGNGHIQELNVNHRLYDIGKNDIEGYKAMLSGSEFFSYPSLRDDVGVSMIARAT